MQIRYEISLDVHNQYAKYDVMTHAQRNASIHAMLEEFAAKAKTNPKFAMKTFVAAGIYTKQGQLTPEYGGPAIKEKHKAKAKN